MHLTRQGSNAPSVLDSLSLAAACGVRPMLIARLRRLLHTLFKRATSPTKDTENMEDIDNQSERDEIPYQSWNELDFSIVTMGMKKLPFFEDDLWLGMQAMNVGIVDSIITEHEYALLREYFEIEKTPMESALAVSALSQMWVYNLYEVLRMWRDRKFQFNKLFVNGGIEPKLNDLPDDELGNLTIDVRRRQLETYRDSEEYRERINKTWDGLEPIYRMVELFRMNLAKHCAPGKDGVIPRAPGYGRINNWCGAMDYELVDSDGYYHYMNRRNIADALRSYVKSV